MKHINTIFFVLMGLLIISVAAGDYLTKSPVVGLYVVSDVPVEGGRYIDTEALSEVGYISSEPNLEIASILSVTGRVSESTSTLYNKDRVVTEVITNVWYDIIVKFPPECADAFGKITADNLDKRMLFMLNNKPLIAPMIKAPFRSDTIAIGIKSSVERDEVMALFSEMIADQN